jgi:hypothetical protein
MNAYQAQKLTSDSSESTLLVSEVPPFVSAGAGFQDDEILAVGFSFTSLENMRKKKILIY